MSNNIKTGVTIGNDGIDYNDLDPDVEKAIFISQLQKYTACNKDVWDEEDVAEGHEKYQIQDPLPGIDPALLNSADIAKYVWKTGMIRPFYLKNLRGASYEVALRGKVIYWDDKGIKQEVWISKDTDSFELNPNSIAFVTLEPYFHIPDYLALRFNLKISHVYKGLLLGTGPLVDPGFQGKLSIPLHNLTTNTYKFYGGDGMIQMEFTKLSHHEIWDEPKGDTIKDVKVIHRRNFIPKGRVVDDYIKKAVRKGSSNDSVVRSAIPEEISKLKKQSREVQKQVDDFKEDTKKSQRSFRKDTENRLNHVQIFNVATTVAIAALVVSLLGFTWGVVSDIRSSIEKEYEQLESKYDKLEEKYNDLNNGKGDHNEKAKAKPNPNPKS